MGSGLVAVAKEVNLSSASVPAIMALLEGSGLLFSLHTSAGGCQPELDSLTSDLVERGVAICSEHANTQDAALILNGQDNLLEDVRAHTSYLMDSVSHADGLQIFIGTENQLFSETGCSIVLAPYHNSERKIIGAVGVDRPAPYELCADNSYG